MKTLFFVMLSVVFMLLTIKSAKGKVPQPQPEAEPKIPANRVQKTKKKSHSDKTKMRDFPQNSPKNEGYFTYETLDTYDNADLNTAPKKSENISERKEQLVENEGKNELKLKMDEEEIQKGIIYSIILERPDF